HRSAWCMCKCMGLFLRFRCEPYPLAPVNAPLNLLCMGLMGVHHPDHRLTALVDVDVLHRDLLLAFAAVAIERIEQSRIGAGELVCLAQSFPVAKHGAPIAFHHRVMACDKLRPDHAFEFIPWLDTYQRIDRRMAFPPDFFRV